MNINTTAVKKALLVAGMAGFLGACATAPVDQTASQKADMTGSRVPKTTNNPNARFPMTGLPLTIISRHQLDSSGEMELGRAMRFGAVGG